MKKLRKEHHMNDELIAYEILPWLPYKDLCKFKTVCKLWGDTISKDSKFSILQSQNSQSSLLVCPSYDEKRNGKPQLFDNDKRQSLFFFTTTTQNPQSFPTQSLSYMDEYFPKRYFVASSNGFLCGIEKEGSGKQDIFVCNPLTKYLEIFQLRSYSLTVGFSFDPMQRCYFLICPYYLKHNKQFIDIGFMLYCSKEKGKWRRQKAILQRIGTWEISIRNNRCCCKSIFVGGKFYWKRSKKLEDLIWYDIKRDVAGTLAAPSYQDCESYKDCDSFEIGDCEGNLSYTILFGGNMFIWVLKKRNWEMQYKLDLELFPVLIQPLPFIGRGILFFKKTSALWSFNLITKKVEKLLDDIGKELIFPYKPSLIRLNVV